MYEMCLPAGRHAAAAAAHACVRHLRFLLHGGGSLVMSLLFCISHVFKQADSALECVEGTRRWSTGRHMFFYAVQQQQIGALKHVHFVRRHAMHKQT